MKHEKFHYKSIEEIQEKAEELHIQLPFAKDTSCLAAPLYIKERELPNRLGIAPMEGADSLPDGSPSDYTRRRYVREAEGGSALIWFEAISIVEEGRSSKTQLLLTEKNLDSYKRLVQEVKEAGLKANGYAPYLVMQANHSGRYSNPDNRPAPMIAYRHPQLEQYRQALERLPGWQGRPALMRWILNPVMDICWQNSHPPIPVRGSTAAVMKIVPGC